MLTTLIFTEVKPFRLYMLDEEDAHLCPVRAIAQWIESAQKEEGPLFRKMNSGDRVSDEPLVSSQSCRTSTWHLTVHIDVRDVSRVVSELPRRCGRLPVPIRHALFSPRGMSIFIRLFAMGAPENSRLGRLVHRVQLGNNCDLSHQLVGRCHNRAGKFPPAGDAASAGVHCLWSQLRLWWRILNMNMICCSFVEKQNSDKHRGF